MRTFRTLSWGIIAVTLAPSLLAAQPQEKLWQKLATFPTRVLTIHFLNLPGPPRIGLVGCDNAVYRTTDAGETWREVTYVRSIPNDPFMACDFTFKDSLTGWFANWDSNAVSPYYLTTDGGQTWTGQSAPAVSCSAIYYNPSNSVLFLSGWLTLHGQHSCISVDQGNTWQVVDQITSLNGYAFLDGQFGVVTDLTGRYRHTTDGGITWQDCILGANESWQPAADSTTHTIWAASEAWPTLGKSTDNGVSVPDFLSNFYCTGTLRAGSCGSLFAQRSSLLQQSNEGIIVSNNQAVSWNSLTDKLGNVGPSDKPDTRFFVKGSYIYAPSSTNEIWRYIGDSTKYAGGNDAKPQATLRELHIFANDCAPATRPLYIHYLNDCTDAQLTNAKIDPPDRFRITGLTLPQTVSGDFPITIEHDPLYHTPDTAKLYLVYHSHGVDSYDTVLLTNAIAGSRYEPRVAVTANGSVHPQIASGDTVRSAFTLLDPIPQTIGLDSIAITTIFDSTTLELAGGPNVSSPFSLLREEHTLGTETIVVRVAPKDIASNSIIATQLFNSYLTTQREALYTIREIRFKDSVFNGCVATAAVSPAEIPVTILGCGDSTARAFLRGESLIQILSVGSEIKVASTANIDADLEVFNSIGQTIQERSITLNSGTNTIIVNDLQSGFYTCRILDRTNGSAIASLKFVVVH